MREVGWNAGIALARLGDARGSRMVELVLLDREALSKLPSDPANPVNSAPLSPRMQDQIMLLTLRAARDMTDPGVSSKIEKLAEDDPSQTIREAARQVIRLRQRADDGDTPAERAANDE
jgi:hypothetical protein